MINSMEGRFVLPSIAPLIEAVSDVVWQPHITTRVPSDRYSVCSVKTNLAFREILTAFAPVRDAWLARIEPGGYVGEHTDPPPYYERWQIPILVGGDFDQATGPVTPEAGVPFQVVHWQPHGATNPTDQTRVHLIVERDVLKE